MPENLLYYDIYRQKKGGPRAALLKLTNNNQGLVGSLLPPAAITIPPITAAAARTAMITPLPPPILFSLLRTAPARFTFDTAVALAAGAAAAITGALISDAAAIAANEILPKRIVMLLIFHTKCVALNI
jgi:hypothetical protein